MCAIGRSTTQFHVKKSTAAAAPSKEKEREVLYSPNTLSGRHGRAAKRAFYSIPRAELQGPLQVTYFIAAVSQVEQLVKGHDKKRIHHSKV